MNGNAYTPPNLHRVEKNETFASISRRYKTGYGRLMAANPNIVPEKLKPGAVIVIPGRIKEAAKKAAKSGAYAVQNGDTDWSVARRYGIKPSELRAMNPGVKWTSLQLGTEIKVPAKAPAQVAAVHAVSGMHTAALVTKKHAALAKHTVSGDDNDWIIARGYGITPKRLRDMNPGVNWNRLRPGMKVNVPFRTNLIARITTKRAKVIKDNVLVRNGARTDAARVTMVEYGRIASVADRIGDWYKLKFGGGTVGWVRGDLLKAVSTELIARAEENSGVRVIRRRTADTQVARRSNDDTPRQRMTHATTRTHRSSSSGNDNLGSTVALSDSDREGVIGTAMSRLGTRYRWGGTTPAGFDCSGFTGYVYSRNGKSLPRTASEQSKHGQAVSRDSLKKGDLVFFKTTRSDRVSHVGIYVGDGKFVHASSGGGRVRVNNLSDDYYSKRFAGARRVAGGGSSSSSAEKKSRSKSHSSDAKSVSEENGAMEKLDASPADEPKTSVTRGTDVTGR